MTAALDRMAARSLISDSLFRRLVNRIRTDQRVRHSLAERIMDQTLAFLATCARDHRDPLGPSPTVDIGWHTFLLYTKEYARFCDHIGGRFIHHVPDDDGVPTGDPIEILARTVSAIEDAGFRVDHELWAKKPVCTPCHNGCADDPPPNPPPRGPKKPR
jgi:hypothetical protein